MPIAAHTLEILEFPRVRERLAAYTSFSASRTMALALQPSTELDEVRLRLRLTSETRRLLDEVPQATIGGARDVREAVRHAERGGILEATTFLAVANTLRSMRQLGTLLQKCDPEIYPLLQELAADLPNLSDLEDRIERTLADDGTVLASASPALERLRREIRTTHGRLQERLQNLITSSQYAGALQEPIMTIRDGRYVVPVKATHRRNVPGLVHDQSASGATLYIEPMAVVELNNQWREAQIGEQQEIQRILAALSALVGQVADVVVTGVDTLAVIDLAFAQARYALALRCVAPQMAVPAAERDLGPAFIALRYQAPLLITQARHPLLDQEQVVPIDVWLGDEFQLLLITGPNTGGKTVALKTVGLLALMAQAGLHIPAREPVYLPLLNQIFADIGDEQSIEQSLSTFSSHMTNIIRILETIERNDVAYDALSDTLILLDELGAGTDPVEGAALARAICQRLLERNCLAICTTHYAELKAFAHNTPGIENASVEFDLDTLAPTYHLTIGLPGRSNALAIATRLGLDPSLVELARGAIDREEVQIESLLADIRQERAAAAEEHQRASEVRADAERYRQRYTAALREFEETLQLRLEEYERQLEAELRNARSEARRQRGEAPGTDLARKWSEEAAQRLQELQAQAEATGRRVIGPPDSSGAGSRPAPRPLHVGENVLVPSLGLRGEILSIDDEDGTAAVQVGGFRVEVTLKELQRGNRQQNEPTSQAAPQPQSAASTRRNAATSIAPAVEQTPPTRGAQLPPVPDVSMTLDMRGWRTSDVSDSLERYLNEAYLADLPSVRLIHGKGSGALRQTVRDQLRQHPLVASFTGGGADGGEGVTIARLTER